MNKSRPVVIVFSILAGLDVIAATSGLGDLIGLKAALVFVLATKAVQVGMTFYVQNLTVPLHDVAAYVTGGDSPTLIAGPASAVTDGTEVTVEETPAG